MSLRVTLPAYPNKKFSAYVFGNNALLGVVRSNAVLDSTGSLNIDVMAVDANNCVTSKQALAPSNLAYHIHTRIDSSGNSGFINPNTGCPMDAGFLSTAGQGYVDLKLPSTSNYTTWPQYVSYVYSTSVSSFSFSNTGVGTATRGVKCSILDGQILNPTIFTTSTLGYVEGPVAFTSGSSNSTQFTTMTFAGGFGTSYKYACWIDANNSGTYNSGDLIASGPGSSASISSWTIVP